MNTSDDEGKIPSPGKAWATAGFLLGVAMSVAGNVAHTSHPSAAALAAAGKTAAQWHPERGAQLAAAFFPLALLVTVEVLARVQWPTGWSWATARYGGTALVAAVAAIVSYLHLRGLLLAYGEDGLTALIGPLAVDGLMIVCGFALIAISRVTTLAAAPVTTPADRRPEAAPAAAAPLTPAVEPGASPILPSPIRRPAQLAAAPPLAEQSDEPAASAAPAHIEDLVSVAAAPQAPTGAPLAKSVVDAVRLLVDSNIGDPAVIAERVPQLVGRHVPQSTIDRARRRVQSEAAAANDRQNTGAYL